MTVRLLPKPLSKARDAGHRRHHAVRAKSVSMKRLTKHEREAQAAAFPDDGKRRLPLTRGECEEVPRPCPYVSCRMNLFLDVSPRTGSIKLNHPDLEPDEVAFSCALDVAELGPATLEEVALVFNWVRERVRQVEDIAIEKLRRSGVVDTRGDEGGGGVAGPRVAGPGDTFSDLDHVTVTFGGLA